MFEELHDADSDTAWTDSQHSNKSSLFVTLLSLIILCVLVRCSFDQKAFQAHKQITHIAYRIII